MTPGEFAAKWRGVETSERASAQSHFLDLCALLGKPGPTETVPRQERSGGTDQGANRKDLLCLGTGREKG